MDEIPVTMTVNGERATRVRRRAQDARRLPARGLRAHRHAPRVRARRVRRVHGVARRRGRAFVPAVRGAGRRRRGHDGRRAGRARRRAVAGAGRVPRGARSAVRLLHARLRRVGHRVARGRTRTRPNARSAKRLSGNLCRCTGYQGIVRAVQRAAGQRRMEPLTSTAGRFVGQSVKRREDPRLLTGHGRYVDDVMLPGMLHCAFVRSDVARGRITRLDVDAARALAGVVAVLTGADLNARVAGSMQPTLLLDDARARRCVRSPTATCGSSATRSRSSSPRAVTSPRTRSTSSRSTSIRARGRRRRARARRQRDRSCTPSSRSNVGRRDAVPDRARAPGAARRRGRRDRTS